MAGDPFYQSLDPQGAPDPVTPADSPADSAGWAMVTPHGQGTAPYDIQADDGTAGITSQFNDANALTGAGVLYPQSPRQTATEKLLYSPQGFNSGTGTSGYDITQGWSGGPDESWPNNVQPSSILETPVQGSMDYPADSTMQDGVPTYGC